MEKIDSLAGSLALLCWGDKEDSYIPFDNDLYEAFVRRLNKWIIATKELELEKSEILDCLRELYDCQNDAPLELHREQWESVMARAGKLLTQYNK